MQMVVRAGVESSDEREQRCGGSCWWQVMLRVVMNVSCAVVVRAGGR